MCAVSPDSNAKHLVVRAAKQRARAEQRARGEPVRQVIPGHRLERVLQREVCTEDLHRHHIVHRQASGLHGRFDSVHDQFRLDPRILRGSVALRIYSTMARNIESVAKKYNIAERTKRSRAAAIAIHEVSISTRG